MDEKNPGGTSAFFLMAAAGIVPTRPAGGKIRDKFGRVFVVVPSSLFMISSLVLLHFFPSAAMARAAAVLFGPVTGSSFPSPRAPAVSRAPAGCGTPAAALFLNGFDLGAAATAALMGMPARRFRACRVVRAVSPTLMVPPPVLHRPRPAFDRGRGAARKRRPDGRAGGPACSRASAGPKNALKIKPAGSPD
jgi:predicted MFS family arabinose efflux permease